MNTPFFNYEVSEQIGAYVYRLIDPRNNETFYVGKGRGNRIFQHALEARITWKHDDELMPPKLDRIKEIQESGHTVDYVIHRHGLTDETAFEVEAALIDAYQGLSNAVRGHHTSQRGLASVDDLLHRYNLPPFPDAPEHRLLLITVNKLQGSRDRERIRRLTRYCWKLNVKNAEKVDFVLAADRGVVVGVFKPVRWQRAIAADFPDIPGVIDEPNRLAFHGDWAAPAIESLYVGTHGKRLDPNIVPPARNPCRYLINP